jgi:cation:H+ antiporter
VDVVTVLAIALGIALLVGGAELLVRGASAIAGRLGVAPVVIGLTVVALGTSAPELAIGVRAAAGGDTEVAFGNVLGSNIANVLLILGSAAVISSLSVAQRIVRLDVPIVIAVSVAVFLLAVDGNVGRIDGALLLVVLVVYLGWLVRDARRESPDVLAEYRDVIDDVEGPTADRPLPVQGVLILGGLAGLVVGGELLVDGAVEVAAELGVSDLVIGLTVVAIGTSLPELATSVLAALRGQRDMAVGNVIGSNVLNLTAVLGATSVVAADGVPVSDTALRVDLPVMLLATALLVPVLWNGFVITRTEGMVLLAAYGTYLAYVVLDAGGNRAATTVELAAFVLVPLAFAGFGLAGFRGWRQNRHGAGTERGHR